MLIHGGSLLLSHSLQFFPHASLLCGSTIRTASFSFKRSCVPEFRNPRSVGDDDRHGERRSGWEDRIGMKEEVEDEHSWMKRVYAVIEAIPEGNSAIISASLVGVLTGICVVLFNNSVNEIRDFFWDGIPDRGASWLREAPIEETWKRTILVPVCGGVFVGMLNVLRDALDGPTQGVLVTRAKAAFAPLLKSLAACITLGTGNSLGPEGPSVEIGSAIAKGIGTLFDRRGRRKVPLIASGSAAGISSGWNVSAFVL